MSYGKHYHSRRFRRIVTDQVEGKECGRKYFIEKRIGWFLGYGLRQGGGVLRKKGTPYYVPNYRGEETTKERTFS